ncbi:TPA: hypothetical protein R2K70_003137 [Raoultella ornithinolytica]|nr:hypothetical protein [Raoultella ornithinolytica]
MAITDTQQTAQFAASAAVSAAEAKQYALSIEKPLIDISESVSEAKDAAVSSELARDEAKDIASGLSESINFELAEKEAEFESQMQGQRTAFEVSQQDKESDFLSSQSQREADFVESQTDRGNRFQAFLDSSGSVFLGDYEDGPFQFSARNQYIRYNNQYYRLNAATDVGFTTTGTDAVSFANDVTHFVLIDGDTLRQELDSREGDAIVAAEKVRGPFGGTLAQTVRYVSVDAFGADPTGETDSTAAVISAANAAKEMIDSAYAAGDDHFYRVVFGNGIYMLGDVPLYSFISYEGQGEGTLIKPLAGASFCFTTTGTTPATSTPLKRLFGASVKNMRIGAAYYDYTFPIVARVGGINIKYASYITIDNVKMRRVDGPGLVLSEVWDSDFINMQLLYTGNIRDSENLMPALTINRGDSSDGSNGLRFWGLHIEQCAKSLQIETGVRQVFFMAPKIEAGSTSSTIVGTQGISFSHAHLTWARHDIPQFLISRTSGYESYGVHFESPQFNSGGTANRGWYIHHNSSSGQVSVTNPVAKSVKTMISGINIVCNGGNVYGCGPDFIKGTGNCVVDGLVASTILGNSKDGVAPTDGTGDFIIVSGAGNVVRDCSLHAVGTSTDGLAFINIAGSVGDVVCRDNQFSGIRQIGVRGTQSSYKIRNNSVLTGAVVPTIMSGAAPRYVVLSAHASGTGPGGFKSANVSIAAGASGSLEIISGATDILIRGSASLGIPAAKLFADTNRTAMLLVAELGGVFVYGTGGVEGDGKIYISKSGSNLIITNYTTSAGTFYVTALSAVM